MIWWDLILKTDDIGRELERLYEHMSLRHLSEYLGVSKTALRNKLVQCGIPLRPRGGPHYRVDRLALPDNAADLNPAQLAKLTGYTINYCKKLRRKLREQRRTPQTEDMVKAPLPPFGDVDEDDR